MMHKISHFIYFIFLWMMTLAVMETLVKQRYIQHQPEHDASHPVVCQTYPASDNFTCARRCTHQLCDAFKIEDEECVHCFKMSDSAAVPLSSLASPQMFTYSKYCYQMQKVFIYMSHQLHMAPTLRLLHIDLVAATPGMSCCNWMKSSM